MAWRDQYAARIDRVLRYIDAHLAGDLCLATLAGIADFSPYHFHRVFKAMVGETVHAYAKRMRLKSAAVRLRHSVGVDVTRTAMELGFDSPSDFARSFNAAYGVSPRVFAGEGRGLLDGELTQEAASSVRTEPREVTVRRLLDCTVAYIRCVGLSRSMQNRSIENAFARLFAWARAHDLVSPQTRVIGVTLDSPEAVPLSLCRFNASITVPESTEPTAGIMIGKLGADGPYACMSLARRDPHYPEVFFSSIDFLYKTWLPDSGFVPADKPFLEFYREEASIAAW